MSAPVIEGVATGEVDCKRLHLPGVVLKATCPKCSAPCVQDFGDHYLSYPSMNAPEVHTLYCTACEHEWPVTLTLTVSLTAEVQS